MKLLEFFNQSILAKLSLIVVLTTTVTLGLLGFWEYNSARGNMERGLQAEAEMLADRLALSFVKIVWDYDRKLAENVIRSEMRKPSVEGILVREKGEPGILYSGWKSEKGDIITTGIPSDKGRYVEAEHPIIRHSTPIGTVRVFLTRRYLQESLSGAMRTFLIRVLLLDLVMVVLLVVLIRQHLTRPLWGLRNAMAKMKGGRLDQAVDITSSDEIGQIAGAFNTMARELGKREADLLESEERYRILVENANDGVVMVQDQRILFCNQRMAEILGYEGPEEIEGRSMIGLIHEEDRERVLKNYRLRQQGADIPSSYEVRGVRKDGLTVFLDLSVATTMLKGKMISIAFLKDITGRRRLERMLQQSQKMEAIGTLAGGIAHDFNNILGVIIGCTELAIMKNPDDSPSGRHLQQVLDASQRAADLVQQILAFSRQQEMDRKPLRVSLIIKEVAKMLRSTLPAFIDIQVNIDSDSGMILADPVQVHQIVMNLSTNAAHAMKESGGVLKLGLSNVEISDAEFQQPDLRPGPYLKLTVFDTGHGMEKAVLERIFDPYFTTKRQDEGTGLGLAVVMGIVRDCQGAITVESEPGEGACFEVLLPRVNASVEKDQHPTQAEALPRGTERILLIDDEVGLGTIAENMLRRLGYRVQTETDSLEALRHFMEDPHRFDLVISDVSMPRMTGDVLSREFLEIRPDIPIILCTGFSERLNSEQARAIGVREFLLKPLKMEVLAGKIRQVLDGRAGPPSGNSHLSH